MWLVWKGNRKIGAWLSESESVSRSAVSDSATPRTVAHRLLCPWDSPGTNTGEGCHFLLQGIFQTQEPWSPALQMDSYHLSHQGSPRKGEPTFMIEQCA